MTSFQPWLVIRLHSFSFMLHNKRTRPSFKIQMKEEFTYFSQLFFLYLSNHHAQRFSQNVNLNRAYTNNVLQAREKCLPSTVEDRRLSSVTRQLIEEKKAKEESNRQLQHFQELVEKLEKVFLKRCQLKDQTYRQPVLRSQSTNKFKSNILTISKIH